MDSAAFGYSREGRGIAPAHPHGPFIPDNSPPEAGNPRAPAASGSTRPRAGLPGEHGERPRDAEAAPAPSSPSGPRLSTVVMHHPSRDGGIRRLLDRLAPLAPRLVVDPRPDGPRSPLRTAKRAWRAVAEGATHHLVLQDDIEVCEDFADHLLSAVRARPNDVIALYVNADSPSNSYAVRHAAAIGAPWAALVPGEFVPTLALVVPARTAVDLADFLDTLPDELRDDDAFVDLFCRLNDLPVFATVPNLVEHGTGPSAAGNDSHGSRRSVVHLPSWERTDDYWEAPAAGDRGTPMRAAGAAEPHYAISIRATKCVVRFLHASDVHPLRQPCAAWQLACATTGTPVDSVLAALTGHVRTGEGAAAVERAAGLGLPPEYLVDLWAAGFLLGSDAIDPEKRPPERPDAPELLHRTRERAMDSWIDSGFLSPVASADRAEARSLLTTFALAAVDRAHGRTRPRSFS